MTSNLPPTYRRALVETVRKALGQGRTATFTVRGDSMVPTLRDGDQVRIVPADPDKLQREELVTYVDACDQIFTHRVVRVEGAVVVTRGDNEDHDDPPVPFGRVVGKVEE